MSTAAQAMWGAAVAKTPENPRDLIDRMSDAARETLVLRAIENVRPGNRPGSRSMLWTAVSLVHLLDLAKLHLISNLPAKDAAESIGKPLEGIGSRVIDRWLKLVREEYIALVSRRLEEAGNAGQSIELSGDLPAQLGLVWGSLAVKVTSYINLADWNDLSIADRHSILRFMESFNDAAKIQAEARRTEAQTDAIVAKLRSVCQSDKGPKSGKTPAERLKEVSVLVDDLVGLKRTGSAA